MIAVIVGSIALSIALLVWVARDAKNRGMDNSVMWMILVFFTSFIGLIIYIFSRPQGNLVACPSCKNKRLEVSAKCPHCGNP
ncbi:MAG TPA: PLD nuclease N-terminal domain-containing protein [Chthoniobacterales bacterium]